MITGTGYIPRKEFMLLVDVSQASTPEWELIGDKVEDMSLEMNPNVETTNDVTGKTSVTLDRYEVQTSISPIRARRESKFHAILYDLVVNEKTLTDAEFTFCAVNVFDEVTTGEFVAWTQKGIIAVQSYGGNTQGLDIPANVHFVGDKEHGKFVGATKTFTAGGVAKYLTTLSISGTASARLAGVEVTIGGQIIYTDDNGIAAVYLPNGTHSIVCIKAGYSNKTDSVTVNSAPAYKAITMTT